MLHLNTIKKTIKKTILNPKTYAYIRVSSLGQSGPNHVSLEAQLFQINKFLEYHRFPKVDKVISEVGSARNPKLLPALTNLIKTVPNGSNIWIHRMDRFSRNVDFAIETLDSLATRRVAVCSVMEPNANSNSNQNQEHMLNIFEHAQYESDHRSKVIKQTFDAIKANGGILGAAPFGTQLKNPKKRSREEVEQSRSNGTYTLPDRSVVSNFDEQCVLEILRGLRHGSLTINQINSRLKKITQAKDFDPIIIDDHETGEPVETAEADVISYQNLADLMNDYSIPYRRKTLWSGAIVKRLLNNPMCNPDDETKLMLDMDSITMADSNELPSSDKHPVLRRQNNIGPYVPSPSPYVAKRLRRQNPIAHHPVHPPVAVNTTYTRRLRSRNVG